MSGEETTLNERHARWHQPHHAGGPTRRSARRPIGSRPWSRRVARWHIAIIAVGLATFGLAASAAENATAQPNMAFAWGSNSEGQLGDGARTLANGEPEEFSLLPVPVAGLSGVLAVAGGAEHSLGLLETGKVDAWGANGSGQLGNGNTVNSDEPVQVLGVEQATEIAAGLEHSVACGEHTNACDLKGKVMDWGLNA